MFRARCLWLAGLVCATVIVFAPGTLMAAEEGGGGLINLDKSLGVQMINFLLLLLILWRLLYRPLLAKMQERTQAIQQSLAEAQAARAEAARAQEENAARQRQALAEERRTLSCLNCGAACDGSGEQCSYCKTPLMVIDLPRLAHALRQQPGNWSSSPRPDGVPMRWECRGCGQPLDPSREVACTACGAPDAQRAISSFQVHQTLKTQLERLDPRFDHEIDSAMAPHLATDPLNRINLDFDSGVER